MMFECVFTTQKTKKKKKWEDGFVEKKGRGIILYNEDKKVIFKNERYSMTEEGYLDTGQYLIYSDSIEEIDNKKETDDEKDFDRQSNDKQNCQTDDKRNYNKQSNDKHNYQTDDKRNYNKQQNFDTNNNESKDEKRIKIEKEDKINGRNNDQILDLFNK